MVSVALKEKHRLEGLRHGKVGLIGRRDRMPTRASVKRTSNPLEGIETDCQALLGRFAGTEDHATVRVGSAAMSAPFAFWHRIPPIPLHTARSFQSAPALARILPAPVWSQNQHTIRLKRPIQRQGEARGFASHRQFRLMSRHGEAE